VKRIRGAGPTPRRRPDGFIRIGLVDKAMTDAEISDDFARRRKVRRGFVLRRNAACDQRAEPLGNARGVAISVGVFRAQLGRGDKLNASRIFPYS